MRQKKLFIIEAPGKSRAFYSAAKKAYPTDDITVWATKGLIADLPVTEVGLDFEQYKIKKEVLNKNGMNLLQTVQDKLNEAGRLPYDYICVCTDPDKEGEYIAGQVYRLLAQFSDERRICRGVFETINSQSVRDMQTYPRPRVGLLDAREFRRVSDRVIPLTLAENADKDTWTGYGRVQFSILQAVREMNKTWKPFKGEGFLYYRGNAYSVNSETESEESYRLLLDTYRAFLKKEATVEQTTNTITVPPPKPSTFASVFARQPKEKLPLDIAEALQEAYITGMVSYPRSMTTAYQPFTIDRLSEFVRYIHLGMFIDGDRIQELKQDTRNLEEELSGHYGIHPNAEYDWETLLLTNPENLTPAQTIAKYVLADACASTMKAANIQVENLHIRIPGQQGITLRAQRWIPIEKGFLSVYQRLRTPSPYFQASPSKGSPLQFVRRRPTRQEIISELHRLKIGQVSQVVHTLETLIEQGFVSGYMKVTKKGSEVLDYLQTTNPKLAMPGMANRLVETLALKIQAAPEQYRTCVDTLLSELGIDIPKPPNFENTLPQDNHETRNPKTENGIVLEADREFDDFNMDWI